MFNPLKLLSPIASSTFSFLSGAKVWLIAIALATVVAFATGWYSGSTHEARIMADAATHAAEQARKAQSDKDDADWAKAKADYDKRHSEDAAANDRLAQLLAKRHILVPNPKKVTVSAEAMKALNDPAIIGTP